MEGQGRAGEGIISNEVLLKCRELEMPLSVEMSFEDCIVNLANLTKSWLTRICQFDTANS